MNEKYFKKQLQSHSQTDSYRERERGCETKPSNEKQEIAFFFSFFFHVE
jgi:hypothetical protein